MSTSTVQRTYTIKEAAALTGLPASTLRYYEQIGIITPIDRGESSKHRIYTDEDLDLLTWVACLSATGMSVSDMRSYVENRTAGRAAAAQQIELLTAQRTRLALEAERLAVRERYVELKIEYWKAVAAGDDAKVERLSREARSLADDLRPPRATTT